MTEGWKCPVCGRGVAPGEKYCNHDGARIGAPAPSPNDFQRQMDEYRRLLPAGPPPPQWQAGKLVGCACGPGQVCANAACPNRPVMI